MDAGNLEHRIKESAVVTINPDGLILDLNVSVNKLDMSNNILENKYFPWYFQPATVPNPLTAPKLTTYNNNKPKETQASI